MLLGNPGYGKSYDLSRFAIDLWETREQNNLTPVFYILKNFSSDSTIESLLPKNYKFIHNIVLILDGFDEIENIIDFSNKLRNFISQNSEYIGKSKMKFLISCRTNVYKKFIKNISDFKVCFLDEVNIPSALRFLKEKFELNVMEHRSFDVQQHRELLENPFYLDLIGKNYQNNKTLLTNKAHLIAIYVSSRLEEDRIDKYQNDIDFDTDKIISYTQKTSFALEAMQKPSLKSSELKRLVKIEATEFSKTPFLEENLDNSWSFVKKNIQEYFVASLLKELSFDEIISFLTIDISTKKIHPTWYNVLTFLLNLDLDKTKHDNLVDWLLENDFEILFSADSNRINDDIRNKVLKDFFVKKCINETLWIIDVKKIASFSQSSTNIDYLIQPIQDKKNYRRARVSAILLLSNMEVDIKFHEEIKILTINILQERISKNEEDMYLKQDIVALTKNIGINNDLSFFNQIIDLVKNNDRKEIISAIINSVPTKSIETNLHYFLEILDKAIGKKQWKTKSKYNTIYSRKESLFDLFKRIETPETLLVIYSFLIQWHKYQIRESIISDFSKHIETTFKDKSEYHNALTGIISDAVYKDKIRYYEDDLIISVVKSCKIENQVFESVLNKIEGNSWSKHFLSHIVKESHFSKIVKRYNEGVLNNDFIIEFRNVVSCRNLDLSTEFEKIIESKTKYRFEQKIKPDEVLENRKFWESQSQKIFDVLFNIDEIENQITKLYDYHKIKDINFQEINKIYDDYYADFELQKLVYSDVKSLFFDFFRDYYPENKSLNINNVHGAIISMENQIIHFIVNKIPTDDSNIIITENQKSFLKTWCINKTEEANSNFKYHLFVNNTWNAQKYYLCEDIYKLQKHFKFNLNEELLLNMLWFNHQENGISIE